MTTKVVVIGSELQAQIDRLDGKNLVQLIMAISSSAGNRAQLTKQDPAAAESLHDLDLKLRTLVIDHKAMLLRQNGLPEEACAYAG